MYIIKPGEITNQGRGITIKDQLKDIENIVKYPDSHRNGMTRTYIV